MSEEPMLFPVKLVWTGGKSGNLTVEGKVSIKTGVPSGGPDESILHSPEDLFVASATMCYNEHSSGGGCQNS